MTARLRKKSRNQADVEKRRTVLSLVRHARELGIVRTIVYFGVPLSRVARVAGEFKERVSADCAEMKGWRRRPGASYNVQVHTTVEL